MTRDEVITRARSVVNAGCHYGLGKGGMHPTEAWPWNQDRLCDCSGFAMWGMGQPRFDGTKWWDTSAIHADAEGPHARFQEVPWNEVLPGDVLVYPDHDGKQGHIGIVASTQNGGPRTVVHCSRGNEVISGDAIQETSYGVFKLNNAIVARFLELTEAPIA